MWLPLMVASNRLGDRRKLGDDRSRRGREFEVHRKVRWQVADPLDRLLPVHVPRVAVGRRDPVQVVRVDVDKERVT